MANTISVMSLDGASLQVFLLSMDTGGTNLYTATTVAAGTHGYIPDIRSGPCVAYSIVARNANASSDAFLKLYDARSIVPGTTNPDFEFWIKPTGTTQYTGVLLNGADGIEFEVGLSISCAKTAGTGGTTAPDSAVAVTIITN